MPTNADASPVLVKGRENFGKILAIPFVSTRDFGNVPKYSGAAPGYYPGTKTAPPLRVERRGRKIVALHRQAEGPEPPGAGAEGTKPAFGGRRPRTQIDHSSAEKTSIPQQLDDESEQPESSEDGDFRGKQRQKGCALRGPEEHRRKREEREGTSENSGRPHGAPHSLSCGLHVWTAACR